MHRTFVQLNEHNICVGIAHSANPIIAPNVFEVGENFGFDLLRRKYDATNNRFYGLDALVENPFLRVGEVTNITVAWKDGNGQIVTDIVDRVLATCNDVEEEIEMSLGLGAFNFSAEEPGAYWIRIYSENNCECIVGVFVR